VAYHPRFASTPRRSSFGQLSRVRRTLATAVAIGATWHAEGAAQEACQEAFGLGKAQKAREETQAALSSYREVASPVTGKECEVLRLRALNNIGAILSTETGMTADAVMAYVEFYREFQNVAHTLSPKDREAIGTEAAKAREYVDKHEHTLSKIFVNKPGGPAVVSVDQRRVDVELPSPILVAPGKHQIALESNAENESCRFTVSLKAGESTTRQCWTPEWKYALGRELWDGQVDQPNQRRRACASFQESFDAQPLAYTGFAVARCLEVEKHFEAAYAQARAAEALLRKAQEGEIPDRDGLEKGIQTFLREVSPRLPHLSLVARKRLPGMTATLERLHPSRSRARLKLTEPDQLIRVASGQWSLVVSAPEHLDWKASLEIRPDQNSDHPHEVTIPALNRREPGRKPPRTRATDTRPPVAAWLVAGSSVLTLGGAIASHLHRQSLAEDFNSNGCFTELPQYGGPGCEELNDDVNLFTGLAIGGYAFGAALGGLSAYLFLRSPEDGTPRRSRSNETTLVCSPDLSKPGVACAARF
jgi:hypothetical protein